MAMAMAMAMAPVEDMEFLRGKLDEMKELGSIFGVEEELQQLRCAVEAAGKEWTTDLDYKPLGQIGAINEGADALLEKICCWQERHLNSGVSSSSSSSLVVMVVKVANAITRFWNKIKFRRTFAAKLKELIREYRDVRSATAPSGEGETRPKLEAPERIVGRDEDVEKIVTRIDQLRQQGEEDGRKLHIIPIVGMPGVGKTTVAQMVYAHPSAVDIFDQRIWVHVSPYFDHKRALRRMAKFLQGIEPSHNDEDDEDYIRILKEKLWRRSYLLVLDDVWNMAQMEWDALTQQLLDITGARGTVIVTTSRHDVAEMMMMMADSSDSPYELQGLSEADCLKLFHQLLQEQELPLPQGGEDKEIIQEKRIHGLPLQVLHFTKDFMVDKKYYVPDSISRRIQNYYDSVSSMYEHLPIYLRHCLRFCSLFPQDHKYDVEELGEIWLAHRYADYYFHKIGGLSNYAELWEGCFFLDSTQDKATYKMHYSMHHFAKHLCRGTSQMTMMAMAGSLHNPPPPPPPHECLHLSLLVDSETATLPKDLYSLKKLKTLILIRELRMLLSNHRCRISKIPRELFARIKYLCVLDLQYTMIKRLPRTVGKLLNLRYLNLSRTDITTLPRSIGKLRSLVVLKLVNCKYLRKLNDAVARLVNLEKLDVAGCRCLVRVPPLGSMRKLKCFNIKDCSSIIQMPSSLGLYTDLHTLPRYIVGDDDRFTIPDCSSRIRMPCGLGFFNLHTLPRYIVGDNDELGHTIRELHSLRRLEGELRVENLQNVATGKDAETAQLSKKTMLKSLILQWNWSMRLEWDSRISKHANEAAREVLEELQPNKDLIKLEIISYMGMRFPSWLSGTPPHLSSLEEIKLFNLKRCEALPPLGVLPRLKVVEISGMDAITTVDDAFHGTFPSLQRLTFSQMLNLQKWLNVGRRDVFPRLTNLTFIHCPQMVALERELPSVTELALWLNNERLCNSRGGLKGLAGSLKKLSISLCEQLSESSECEGLQGLRALEEMEISGCQELTNLPRGVRHLNSMKSLTIAGCNKMTATPKWSNDELTSLRSLSINGLNLLRNKPPERS